MTILYLSRTLTPDGMGAVELGIAMFAALHVVSAGGGEVLFAHEATRHPGDTSRLAGRSLLLAWTQLLAIAALLAALAGLFRLGTDAHPSVALFGAAAAIVPIGMRFAFIAEERAWIIGAGTFVGQLAYLGLCVLTVRTTADVSLVALCWLAAVGLRSALPLAAFVRTHGAVVLAPRALAPDLRRAAGLGIGSVARGLLLTVDVLVLGAVCAAGDVARYALATKVPLFLGSLAALFHLTLFPILVRAAAAADGARLAAIEGSVVPALLGIAVPGAVCLAIAAEPVMVRLFTDRFADAGVLLAVLVWRLPLAVVAGFYRTALWAKSPGRDARVAAQVLVVAGGLLFLVVPRVGPLGAAFCMLAADASAVALYANAMGGGPRPGVRPAALARVAAAAALAAGLMLLAVPHEAPTRAVLAALGVWALCALLADLPWARRLLAAAGARAPEGP